MPIEFLCTGCRQLLRTADETAGQMAKCPSCGTIVPIPAASFDAKGPQAESAEQLGPLGAGQTAADLNPYQATSTSYKSASPAMVPTLSALDRVQGPARGLAIIGLLGGVIYLLLGMVMCAAMVSGVQLGPAETPFEAMAQRVGVGISVFTDIVGTLLSGLIVFGSRGMARLSGYRWAMTASIVSIVMPLGGCASGCCLVFIPLAAGIPIGIWAVTVLIDENVKRAFQHSSLQQPFDSGPTR